MSEVIKKSKSFIRKLEMFFLVGFLIFGGYFLYSSVYGVSLGFKADKESLKNNLKYLITKTNNQEITETDKKLLESITSPGNFVTSWQDKSYLSLFRKLNKEKPLGEITEKSTTENAATLNLRFCPPSSDNNCNDFSIYIEKAKRTKALTSYSAWQIYDLKVERVDNCLDLYFDLAEATGCIQDILRSWVLDPRLAENIYQTLLGLVSQIQNPTQKLLDELSKSFVTVLSQFPRDVILKKIEEISRSAMAVLNPNVATEFIRNIQGLLT